MPATISLASRSIFRERAFRISPQFIRAIFAKQKTIHAERETHRRLTKAIKELSMEYLILVAVVSMTALYALIIVGCLKQPEW
jgi:hypothetical protein